MDFFNSIDWDQLREQKRWLFEQNNELAQGLVNLLDNLQDQAVLAGIDEDRVFDKVFD